jgi:hypothetical protein
MVEPRLGLGKATIHSWSQPERLAVRTGGGPPEPKDAGDESRQAHHKQMPHSDLVAVGLWGAANLYRL